MWVTHFCKENYVYCRAVDLIFFFLCSSSTSYLSCYMPVQEGDRSYVAEGQRFPTDDIDLSR